MRHEPDRSDATLPRLGRGATVRPGRGCDPKARDEDGKTPWDYIQKNDALKNTEAYWRLNEARFE